MTDRTRKLLKYLRIAWTAFFAVVTVLLIVLWVRSYFVYDTLYCPLNSPRMLVANSYSGRLSIYAGRRVENRTGWFPQGWGRDSTSIKHIAKSSLERPHPYWAYSSGTYGQFITFPHWSPILTVGIIAASGVVIPQTRFSLRTLLIATTLIAVGMGLVVWATR